MSIKKLLLLFTVFVVAGCNGTSKDSTPQKILSEYVSRSFAVKGTPDKSKLLELTTGEVRKTIDSMDEQSFKNNFLEKNREFIGLKVRDERKLSEEKYSITYELTYQTKANVVDGTPSNDTVTNKKHAIFEKKEGKWLISEVKNLKTMIEHQNEISF